MLHSLAILHSATFSPMAMERVVVMEDALAGWCGRGDLQSSGSGNGRVSGDSKVDLEVNIERH